MQQTVEPQPVAWRWKHPREDRWQYGPNHPGDDERSAYVVEPLFSEALRSERDALREASQWQPIETAPHSKPVLVFVPRADQLSNLPSGSWIVAYQTEPAPPLMQTWRFYNGDFRGQQIGWPTHWMPLPVPPALASTGDRT